MAKREYLSLEEQIDDEQAQRQSIEKFLMQVIYPKLTDAKRAAIDGYVAKGISITGAFEFADVHYSVKH